MPPVIKGDPSAQLKGIHYRYDKQRGWVVDYEYEGPATAIDSLIATATDAEQIESKQDGATRECIITYATSTPVDGNGDEQVFDTWELLGNDVEKSVFQHPNTLVLDESLMAFVRNSLKRAEEDDTGTFTFVSSNNATMLFRHALNGYDGFLLSQYVLRRTSTVPSTSNVRASFTNTFKIHTTAQLKTQENIPANILFSLDQIDAHLPTAPLSSWKYPSDFTPPIGGSAKTTDTPVMKWGWLKRTPTIMQAAGNKFSLTYEYWHAAWSTWIYADVT